MGSSKIARKGGKKNRKYGRNKKFCERYRLEGRREKNRKIRLARHLKRFPDDGVARRAKAR